MTFHIPEILFTGLILLPLALFFARTSLSQKVLLSGALLCLLLWSTFAALMCWILRDGLGPDAIESHGTTAILRFSATLTPVLIIAGLAITVSIWGYRVSTRRISNRQHAPPEGRGEAPRPWGLSLGEKKEMKKTVVHIPKDGIKSFDPAPEAPDTPLFFRLRTTFVIAVLLFYIFMMIYIVRNNIPWLPATTMGIFILTMVLGVSQKIRPGTLQFWKIIGVVSLIVIAPSLSVSPIWAALIIVVYIAAMTLLCVKGFGTFRQETIGWRAIAIGGLFLATMWVIIGSLTNL